MALPQWLQKKQSGSLFGISPHIRLEWDAQTKHMRRGQAPSIIYPPGTPTVHQDNTAKGYVGTNPMCMCKDLSSSIFLMTCSSLKWQQYPLCMFACLLSTLQEFQRENVKHSHISTFSLKWLHSSGQTMHHQEEDISQALSPCCISKDSGRTNKGLQGLLVLIYSCTGHQFDF